MKCPAVTFAEIVMVVKWRKTLETIALDKEDEDDDDNGGILANNQYLAMGNARQFSLSSTTTTT